MNDSLTGVCGEAGDSAEDKVKLAEGVESGGFPGVFGRVIIMRDCGVSCPWSKKENLAKGPS